MKYQIKVVFKKILDSKDLIKKFVSLNSDQIYDFFKEIYTSDEISEHLNFITKEEFWQEILSMITGEKLESLDDLEKVAGGKISIKNRVLPGVLSLLMVGGNLVPGNTGILTNDNVCCAWKINLTQVDFPKPEESRAVLNVINRNPTLKEMFGFAASANVFTLTPEDIAKYKSKCDRPAGAAEAASFPLMLVHAMPLLLQKWYKQNELSIDGLFKLFFDKEEKFSLTNFIGKLKGKQKSGEQEKTDSGGIIGWLYSTVTKAGAGAVDMVTPGISWGEYKQSTEEDLARIQLLTAYYIDYVHTTGATKFPNNSIMVGTINEFFGSFYTDPQANTEKSAVEYANSVLSGYIGKLETLTETEQQQLLDVLKQRFPVLNTVLGTFDKVKGITENIDNLTKNINDLTNADSPDGIPAIVRKAVELISKLTGWHYSEETMKQIKTNLVKITKAEEEKDVLEALEKLKTIHNGRLTKPKPKETNGVECDVISQQVKLAKITKAKEEKDVLDAYYGTPKQVKLDELMTKLCAFCSNSSKKEDEKKDTKEDKKLDISEPKGSDVKIEEDKQEDKKLDILKPMELAKQILDFIEDTEKIKSDFDQIVDDAKSLLSKLNNDDGSLQKILGNLDKGLTKLQENNFFGEVSGTAANLQTITKFIANPLLALGILGAGGATLIESTTGMFSKLSKSSMNCARSAFANIRKIYNENIYNKLVLENDPIKLKKMVSEYLRSTLMFPGQVSDNLAEILSSGTMSSGKPTMLELSGNVSSGVSSAVHKSVFKNNLKTWQTVNQSQVTPRIITRTLENGAKEKIELSLADTLFNTTNPVIKKLLNNTSTTLVFDNLTDSSIIDRLEEVRHNNGVLRLYDNNSGDYVEHDVSNTLFLISNRNNTDQHGQLKFAEQVHFGDFTEEEYAYIVAEKLGDMSASYYDKYKITVDFSDDFVENIARKAVKDHAGYDDAEKYLKPVTPAMIQFLDTEKSEGRPIKKLKLECYEENEKIMFRHQEVLEKQKDVDQIEEISDGSADDFVGQESFNQE